MRWNAVIFGPENTPWDGGTFRLVLEFSEDYPNKAPEVRFVSEMFHPNSKYNLKLPWGTLFCPGSISKALYLLTLPICSHLLLLYLAWYWLDLGLNPVYADGKICLDILQNNWSPIYDVAAILTSIQSMLTDPNPNSPANSEAARLFTENKEEYTRKVKEYVEKSWKEPGSSDEKKEEKTWKNKPISPPPHGRKHTYTHTHAHMSNGVV